jgi:hypothetical protein
MPIARPSGAEHTALPISQEMQYDGIARISMARVWALARIIAHDPLERPLAKWRVFVACWMCFPEGQRGNALLSPSRPSVDGRSYSRAILPSSARAMTIRWISDVPS